MKIYTAIRTALYCALAVLVVVFISTLAEIEILRYFIGGLMIFYGVEEIAFTAIKSKKHYSMHSIYWNVVEIVIGLTLIVFVETGDVNVTYAVVCVSWAIWSILRESRELVEATEEIKSKKPVATKIVAIVSIIESLTVIIFSLTMIIEPGEHHAKIHLYLLAVELLTHALFPVINQIAEWQEEKKHGDKVSIAVAIPQGEEAKGEGAEGEKVEGVEAEGEAAVSANEDKSTDVGSEEHA